MNGQPAQTATSTRYLQVDGGRIAYDVQGGGPLVVLVPGMAELRSSYRLLVPHLVAAGYTVASTDLRGHGESDTTFATYGDPATASDITALLDTLLADRPVERAVVVGNSLAAGAGVIAAAEHPDQVAGLVLVGPFVRNPKVNAAMRLLFRAMTSPLWVATMWKAYLPKLYAGAKPADFADYRAAVVAKLRQRPYGKSFSRTARETDHDPAEARLADVKAPVVVVMGALDPDFPDPAAEADWVASALHGEAVMVPDAGHYPHAQQPQLTADAVLGFLARVHPVA